MKQCPNCNLAITTPRPETENLGKYYQSDEYISHSGKSSGGVGLVYKLARSFSLKWKKNKVLRIQSNGSILDFGCGTGEFLNTMQQAGWSITGIEPSPDARLKAEILNSIKIHDSLQGLTDQKFDIITAWHVLEHVPDLVQTVQKLKSHLKKGGTIFIAVPNYQSPDAEIYKEHWAGFDVPRHLWHFSKKSMNTLLSSADLKLTDTIPMKLDAYYVSLLSEKYKNNNQVDISCLIKGFISGLKSNLLARRKINYSSLIYVAKADEA
ncbi:MAG TPA: class I SAM-dependent methyltransferase [Cyclobacteriaceae bacterium]|nr:class I SAM-dependent methyltransferase [Cyclobacteriaceae bacterium]